MPKSLTPSEQMLMRCFSVAEIDAFLQAVALVLRGGDARQLMQSASFQAVHYKFTKAKTAHRSLRDAIVKQTEKNEPYDPKN